MSEPITPRPEGDDDSAGVPPIPPKPPVPPVPPMPTEPFGAPADAQPTQAYPPLADEQPTLAYPDATSREADVQPTVAYAPAAHPVAPQYPGGPGFGPQPTYAANPYAASPQYGPSPGTPGSGAPVTDDGRPRTLAIAAIIAAAVGLLLTLGGFLPIPGLATTLAVIGGILLLAGFILSIVVLVSKAQGGKPLGIAALAVSVLGGILFAVALFVSLIWLGLAAVGENTDLPVVPGPSASALPSEQPSETPSESAQPQPSGIYDEAAYLAAVRPEVVSVMQEIEPGITEEQVELIYSDETLLTIGRSFVVLESVGGTETGRDAFVQALTSSGASEEQANRFFDAVVNASQRYLVE